MDAREMFEALGYECKHIKQCIYYRKIDYSFMRVVAEITFDLKKRTYHCVCGMAFRNPNKEEERAIQKQKEELGWI